MNLMNNIIEYLHPGGPHNIRLPMIPLSSMLIRSDSGPVKCFCPKNSSRHCGRSLSARGMADLKLEGVPLKRLLDRDDISNFRFLKLVGMP